MSQTLSTLATTAASVALIHTVIGVDHYLPFIALGKASDWSLKKTLLWTTICGFGHVLSSVVLAALASAMGWAVGHIETIDGYRGDLAAYLLVAFGIIYLIWGLRHHHHHRHDVEHDHANDLSRKKSLWALFIIFVLGPCEPLIPLMVAPALTHNFMGAILVVGIFAVITITTMLIMVTLGYLGIGFINISKLHQWAHPLAGAAIAISGGLILLGL